MMLAAVLYAPFWTACNVTVNEDGSIDEARSFTPGQLSALERMLTQGAAPNPQTMRRASP